MKCPKCGTDNPTKFKFCVGCGSNLEDPSELNIEQVDMGGYRSEEDYNSEKNSFKISSGTFTINDNVPNDNMGMFTADELNDTDEEFDFSSYDEPYIPKLNADRITVPDVNNNMNQNLQQPMNNINTGQFQQQKMYGYPQQPVQNIQQPMGVNTYPNQMYTNQAQPQMMYAQPQIIGYDQNGMPIYAQPQMMYAQPQIIGYDQNGMPVYAQPQMMYAQPQIIGYDQNGMPVYAQPQMMYAQPQIIGYDQNGMPVYAQPQHINNAQPAMNGMYGMEQQPYMQTMPQQPYMQQHQPAAHKEENVKVPNKFWNEFFSEENENDSNNNDQDDFFGNMSSVSSEGMDAARLKKLERKKNFYMNDTPSVNAEELRPNAPDKFNKLYMKKADIANADDLEENNVQKNEDIMNVTENVNADDLEIYEHVKTRVVMKNAGEADADELEAYNHEHSEAIMAEAEHAVEALPKKKEIIDEIDAIELPEHMMAKKTVKEEVTEIPSLPEV